MLGHIAVGSSSKPWSIKCNEHWANFKVLKSFGSAPEVLV